MKNQRVYTRKMDDMFIHRGNWINDKLKVEAYILSLQEEYVLWERAFIWAGFKFKKIGDNTFDLSQEYHPENLRYLKYVLSKLGYKKIELSKFSPSQNKISKKLWLLAINELHGGAEGGEGYELRIMDAFMGGIVRIINEIGLSTHFSCNGHLGARSPQINFYNHRDALIARLFINIFIEQKFKLPSFGNTCLIFQTIGRMRRENFPLETLLFLAEQFHNHKTILLRAALILEKYNIIEDRNGFKFLEFFIKKLLNSNYDILDFMDEFVTLFSDKKLCVNSSSGVNLTIFDHYLKYSF
jgi:hypothetical protein